MFKGRGRKTPDGTLNSDLVYFSDTAQATDEDMRQERLYSEL